MKEHTVAYEVLIKTIESFNKLTVGELVKSHFIKFIVEYPDDPLTYEEFLVYFNTYLTVRKLPPELTYADLMAKVEYLNKYCVWCVFNMKGASIGLKPGDETTDFYSSLFDLVQRIEDWINTYNENLPV